MKTTASPKFVYLLLFHVSLPRFRKRILWGTDGTEFVLNNKFKFTQPQLTTISAN